MLQDSQTYLYVTFSKQESVIYKFSISSNKTFIPHVLKYSFILPYSVCREYFQNGGKRKALEKDEKRAVLATKTTPALSIHESSKFEGHLTNLSFTNPEIITE